MKKLILILCFLPILAFGQYTFTSADTTVIITYRIKHIYVLKKTDIRESIIHLTEDSSRFADEKVWWLQNYSNEMQRIRGEKRRLQKLLK